jgi:general secretion pathway protein A
LNGLETRAYINHRLAVAGEREDLFTPLALWLLHRYSRGIPRLINTICERALLAIYTSGKQRIDAKMVWRAAKEVKGHKAKQNHSAAIGTVAGLLLLLAAVGGWYWFDSYLSHNVELAVNSKQQPDREGVKAQSAEPLKKSPQTKQLLPQAKVDAQQATEKPVTPSQSPVDEPSQTDATEEEPVNDKATAKQQNQVKDSPQEIDLEALFTRPQNSFISYQKLFHVWDNSIALNTLSHPCQQAPEYGLRCLNEQADWSRLMGLNRPLLIRIKQGRQERLLFVTHVDGNWLLVDTNESQGVVKLDQLKRYWQGGFVMLWKPHAGLALIGNGSTGEAVTWLRNRLSLAEGGELVFVEGLDRFDKRLKSRLQAFQRENGLDADGVAGQQTQVYLNNLQLPDGTPTLAANPLQGER